MTNDAKTAKLDLPGASLYYEVRGQGPLLLVIPGGPQDAGVFADLGRALADRYTVVAYDPRGNSRSTVEGAMQPLDMDRQADDAAALIEAIGMGPAHVFGTSGGAHIALNLATRYPSKVQSVVAHEPPSMMLLDDPAPALAEDQALYDTYQREGVDAAMAQFFAGAGLDGLEGDGPPEYELEPEAAATMERVGGNFEYWLAHGMLPLSRFVPDVETLRRGKPPVAVAIGQESAGSPIHGMSMALATKLGVEPVPFPGDHVGFESDPQGFAEALERTISKLN